jgi:creatinine amidohydrolase
MNLVNTDWSLLSWPQILELVETGPKAVILPVGATEQHGPHLGTGMDAILADKLCSVVGKRTGVPVLPTVSYGCSIGHSHRWPGTLALSPQTLISVITDIGEWLYKAGFRKLYIINCHVGNAATLRVALDILRCRFEGFQIALFNDGQLNQEIEAEFCKDGNDWHANASETSLMMAIAPECVLPDKISTADDPDRTENCVFSHPVNATSKNGVTGRPSEATAEAGYTLFDKLVTYLCDRITCGLTEEAPLSEAYHQRIKNDDKTS